MFKEWSISDLAKSDVFDGNTSYNVIEAFDTNDRVNKKDLARPIRNAFENQKDLSDYSEGWTYYTSMSNGIIKDALVSEFAFSGDSDVMSISIDPGTGDSTDYYLRLAPGVAMNNKKIAVNRPHTNIAERQLNEIFNLESWGVEGVEIKYYHNVDQFQARIKKNDINGTTINHDFLNGGTWGDSDGGYSSGIELLEAIYDDTTYFRDDFATAVGVELLRIDLEPTIRVSIGDTYSWFVDRNGLFVGDTALSLTAGDSLSLVLYTISIAAGGDSSDYWLDERTYIQNYNDFSTYTFLNVPQAWGDTRSDLLTDPYGDTNLDYADITNQDTFIVFLRKSAGDTQDSSIFGWAETAIPGISETRTEKFFSNKDIISHWDEYGDTLGASWASIKEMSGDSWTFYGNKTFLNGFYEFNVTDATPDSFKIDTLGGIDIDVDNGFTVNENSGGLFTMDTNGAIALTSPNGQDITITAGDSLIIIADAVSYTVTDHFLTATGDIGLTAGDSFIVTADGIYLRGDSSSSIDMEPLGAINITSAVDQDVNITSSGTTADVNITAAGDIIFTATGDSIVFTANIIDYNLTETFDVDASTSIELDGAGASASAIKLDASNAAGGIDLDSGTGGFALDTTGNMINTISGDITFTGDTYTIDILGALDIDTNSGFAINDDSGALLTATTAGRVDLDSAAGQIVDIASDTEVQINGGVLLDLDGTTTTMDSTTLDINTGSFDLDVTSGNIAMNTGTTGDIILTSVGDIDLIASGDTISLTSYTVDGNFTNIDLDASGLVSIYGGAGNSFITIASATASTITLDANGTGADIILNATDDLQLNSGGTADILLDAGANEADITATLIDINGGTGGLDVDVTSGPIGLTTVSSGDITLTSAGDIDLIASGDTILLSSYTLDVNATTVDWKSTGISTIDSVGLLTLAGDAGITLSENSGSLISMGSTGAISLANAGSQAITITATSGIVDINGNELQVDASTFDCNSATADLDGTTFTANYTNLTLTGSIDLIGSVNIGNSGVNYEMGDTTVVSGFAGTATDNGVYVRGSFAAYKVYNAVWNDYAEGFEFDSQAGTPEPGYVYKQTKGGVVKTYKKGEKGTIGVYSDTAGMVMGSKDCVIPELIGTDEDQSEKTKIPIALAGKVKTWIKQKLEIGDLLVAGKDGFATKANFLDRIFRQDSIIGKALEISCCKTEKRIWMLVK
jgi:hypothetical protein